MWDVGYREKETKKAGLGSRVWVLGGCMARQITHNHKKP